MHINAGAAALALCLVLGGRVGFRNDPMRPHNVPFVLLGAGLLWFGWFGFNAVFALAANNLAGIAFMNTQLAGQAVTGGRFTLGVAFVTMREQDLAVGGVVLSRPSWAPADVDLERPRALG